MGGGRGVRGGTFIAIIVLTTSVLFTASPITAPSPCPPPPTPATRLLPLPGLRTSCCHPHPSPFVSTTHVDRSDRSPPLPPVPSSSHCSARRHIKMLLGLFVSVDLGGGKSTVRRRRRRKSEAGSKHLKGDGARSSQMCTNGHSPPPPPSPPLPTPLYMAHVSEARGLLFVFSSEEAL